MPSVFFYISGHGFGHASREIEVINTLMRTGSAGHDIVVRSAAPRALFESAVDGRFTLIDVPSDTGVVQIDSLRLDEVETIRRAADFYRRLPVHVEREAALLRRHEATFVVVDAPPLACAAAHAAGVPSVVLSNFTWDWIYEAYAEPLKAAPDLIPAIRTAYHHADEAWRLPLHGGFEGFDRVIDLPFVARHARHDRAEVRRRLELPADEPLALASFGGYGLRGFDPRGLDCLDRWQVIMTGSEPETSLPRGARFLSGRTISDSGLRYEDLVGAVDIVVTKPGYGIVSECLANGTALLYTSRGRFVEYDVMVAEMPRFLRCGFIDIDSLLAGRWLEGLNHVHHLPPPPDRPPTDGAEIVARMIRERIASAR